MRLLSAIAIGAAPTLFMACGGGDDSAGNAEIDAAFEDVPFVDASMPDAPDVIPDASKNDARAISDASVHVELNKCGGQYGLTLDGRNVTPGTACGTCGEGTVVCIGPDAVECAGADAATCEADASTFDASPNACGGYGSLTSVFGADASVNDSCGNGCGQLQCATPSTLICLLNGTCADAGVSAACSVPDSAYTASPAPLPAEARPTTSSTFTLALPISDFAYNARDGYLYASVLGGTSQANSVVIIDPMTATVVASIYVGVSPSRLSISDDGEVLWVAVSTPASIRRVDLLTRTAGTSLLFPISAPYSSYVNDVVVLPGSHDSVAVSYSTSSGGNIFAVFDGATPRPYASSNNDGDMFIPTASPSLLFTGASGRVGTGCLDADGIFTRPLTYYSYDGFSYDPPVLSSGKLFTQLGDVLDPKTGASVESIPLPGLPNDYYDYDYAGVAADAKDAYFLTTSMQSGGTFNALLAADQTSLMIQGTDLIDLQTNRVTNFIRWGRYGVAFLVQYGGIVIARSTIIPDTP